MTSYIGHFAGDAPGKIPATASAMDMEEGAYKVASMRGKLSCVQSTFASRAEQHLLISEFVCENKGAVDVAVTVQVRCCCSSCCGVACGCHC